MGSSCYSRGNGRNIEAIQRYLEKTGQSADTKLVGHLCEDQCKTGPNLVVNGKPYHQVDTAVAVAIIEEAAR